MFDTLLAVWTAIQPYLVYIGFIVILFLGYILGLSKSGVSLGRIIYTFLVQAAQFAKDAWSEKPGTPSSKRLQNAYAYIIFIPCVAYALVHIVKFHPDLAYPYFLGVLGFIATMFGLQISGKTAENKNGNGTATPDKPAGTP